MALVAIDAVVDVPRHILVMEVGGVVSAMASRALEHRVVVGIRMASRANPVRIAVIHGELRVLRVIKRSAGPCRRVVAGLAGSREELRLCRVSRIRRVLVIGLVAAIARCRQRGVITVHMAIRTLPWRNRMRTGQRERRVVVVEGRVGPDDRVMTQFARSREARSRMVRVVRARVILLVARIAERAGQVVVVVDVAIRAHARRNQV